MNKLNLLKFASLKSDELTVPILSEISAGMGFNVAVDDEVLAQVSALLRENNVNGLADLAGSPALFPKLQQLLQKSPAYDDNLIICPHCGDYINPQA
jgi:hypothetical protein